MYDFDTLSADLVRGGLEHDDTLLVHSSMKKIGEVKGGADTVLNVLMNYFEASGLLVFPSLSYSLVNADSPLFSVIDTPCVVGLLPEMFRRRPRVIRSLHPTHSLAAFGRDAAEFISGHEEFDTPCARRSPFGKLYDRKGKILFIGTGIGCNTYLHGVEEWFGVPNMFTVKPEHLIVIDYNGNRIPVDSRRHVGSHSRYYAQMETNFEKVQAISFMKFGDADCCVLDCRKVADVTGMLLQKNPLLFTEEWNNVVALAEK